MLRDGWYDECSGIWRKKLNLTSDELRSAFLEFFDRKDHTRIADSSLIPRNDPTLLFINSGMAPLKPFFTGKEKPPAPRLSNIQKCIRTNDIADVGDLHHLTFFEMMGSWSIGDYFKDTAIELAYELLVDVLKFDTDRLYATVYSGNDKLGLGPDVESLRAWERVGIADDRIVMLGEDNFWGPAGDSGPCGPCTEVFFDMGPDFGPEFAPGQEFETTSRYIEIWNAGVFMQFDKSEEGIFTELPFTSVDTGCGLERLAMALQGKSSVYETDLLEPLQNFIIGQTGGGPDLVKTYRRLTDHVRSAAFILAEGVLPSNEGRGYVLRRLIRKSIALTRSLDLDFRYDEALDVVFEMFRDSHPLLIANAPAIAEAFSSEQQQFDLVIARGLKRLDALCVEAPFVVSGPEAFELSATYGMPIDLIRELVSEKGGQLDEAAFEQEFAHHQQVSRSTSSAGSVKASEAVWAKLPATPFVGYDDATVEACILSLAVSGESTSSAEIGAEVELVVDRTTFYPVGGGQVGDSGIVRSETGEVSVTDTRRTSDGGAVIHVGTVIDGHVAVGQKASMEIDESRRRRTEANHSATHLLHAALKATLGTHVHQAGSLVEADYLRFDFTHPSKVEFDVLSRVELRVNEVIRQNVERETYELPLQEAIERGAEAMFGEKYGDVVRVVQFGGESIELCGGAHVLRTGDIGLFRIIGEESVGKGTRRITASTGSAALQFTMDREATLHRVLKSLGVPLDQAEVRVADLMSQKRKQSAATESTISLDGQARDAVKTLSSGVRIGVVRVDGRRKSLKSEIVHAANSVNAILLGVGDLGAKATAVLAVPASMDGEVDATALLTRILEKVGGRGGGSSSVAQGGIPDGAATETLVLELEHALGN